MMAITNGVFDVMVVMIDSCSCGFLVNWNYIADDIAVAVVELEYTDDHDHDHVAVVVAGIDRYLYS